MSGTMRHQLVCGTALLGATGRKYGSGTDTIPGGEGLLHSNVPRYVKGVRGRFDYVRPLINDPEGLYDLRANPEESDNLAIKPERRERLVQVRELAIAGLQGDSAGFADRMPAVRDVR